MIFFGLLVLLVLYEVAFYAGHRCMHALLPKIHAVHHSARRPVGFQAFHAHPFEVAAVNLGPVVALQWLLRLPSGVLSAALALGLANTVLSGHTSRTPDADHQRHHLRGSAGRSGNYGFLLMDWLCGTRARKEGRFQAVPSPHGKDAVVQPGAEVVA